MKSFRRLIALKAKKIPYDTKTFYAAEYVALRAEVLLTLGDVNALERYVAAACASLWAWAATHPGPGQRGLLAVPFALSVLGVVRAIAYLRVFQRTSAYICQIETFLGDDSFVDLPGGWEHFTNRPRLQSAENNQSWKSGSITWSAAIFWVVLIFATVAAFFVIPQLKDKPVQSNSITVTCAAEK